MSRVVDAPATSLAVEPTEDARRASEVEVLAILRSADVPLTASEIERAHRDRVYADEAVRLFSPQRLRSACARLREDELIENPGVREGGSPFGNRAMTWAVSR